MMFLTASVAYVIGASFVRLIDKYLPVAKTNPELVLISFAIVGIVMGPKIRKWVKL